MLAAQELQRIVSRLTQSNRSEFAHLLEDWRERWDDFLKEKTYEENGVNFQVHPTFGVMRQSCSAYSLS